MYIDADDFKIAALVIGCILAVCVIFSTFGMIAWVKVTFYPPEIPDPPRHPSFRRDMLATCDVFYCANGADPNPSYFPFQTPPFIDGTNTHQYSDSQDVFDIRDNTTIIIKKPGVYLFTLFAALLRIADPDAEAAIVLSSDDGMVLMSPVIAGDVTTTQVFGIAGNISIATSAFSTQVHFRNETWVRVGYKVSADVLIAPGAYLTGIQLSDFN
jgi:hypothetical protein